MSAEKTGGLKGAGPAKLPQERTPDQDQSKESDETESEESDSDEDDEEQAIPDEGEDDNTSAFCDCRICLAFRRAGVHHTSDPTHIAVHRARVAVRMIGRAIEEIEIPESVEEVRQQRLARKDLRDVVEWAVVKTIKLTIPLKDQAIKQLVVTLFESAEAGRVERSKKNGAPAEEVEALQKAPAIDAAVATQALQQSEITPVQAKIGTDGRQSYMSDTVIKSSNRKRRRVVTKWDVLRGLKLAAEEFVQVGTVMSEEQYDRFFDASVVDAPNLPPGAYTILRNGILAENVGELLVRLHGADGKGGLDQSEGVGGACRDPVARRWKTLKRDFPDIQIMISRLQPERSRMRTWIASGKRFSSSCSYYIVAADKKSGNAIAQALEDGRNLYGQEDLSAFTKRLADIDKDARFLLEKPELAIVDPREARCKELVDLGIKIIGQYPGLSDLISLETKLPYHPNDEECPSDEEG